MALARAFTLRHKRTDSPPSTPLPNGQPPASPGRAQTVKRMGTIVDRNKISAPVELLSTTNMLSYNAPDVSVIRQMRQISSSTASTSSTSGDDSDGSSPTRSSAELTDASSVDGASSPITPEHNHLSCYFQAAQETEEHKRQSQVGREPRRSLSTSNFHRKTPSVSDPNALAIPQRALSHSKSAHLQVARKRSMQSLSSDNSANSNTMPGHSSQPSGSTYRSMHSVGGNHNREVSRSSSFKVARASADFFKGDVEPNHPFGKELEQLSEVAEELGGTIRDAETQDDLAAMRERKLKKWTADDYLQELMPLYGNHFASPSIQEAQLSPPPQWI